MKNSCAVRARYAAVQLWANAGDQHHKWGIGVERRAGMFCEFLTQSSINPGPMARWGLKKGDLEEQEKAQTSKSWEQQSQAYWDCPDELKNNLAIFQLQQPLRWMCLSDLKVTTMINRQSICKSVYFLNDQVLYVPHDKVLLFERGKT